MAIRENQYGADYLECTMETAGKSENSEEDYSQIFGEDESLNLSSVPESHLSNCSVSIHRARDVDGGRINTHSAAEAFRNGEEKTRRSGGSRFKTAARTVQTAQTVTKTFASSQQVRDAVYQEWLSKKSNALKSSQQLLHEERRKNEAAIRKQNVST